MNEISKKINERKEFLMKLKYEKESSLKNCSDGQLRISLNGKNPRYYQSFREEGKCDKYLSLKEMNLIRELAQKYKDKITIKCGFEADYYPTLTIPSKDLYKERANTNLKLGFKPYLKSSKFWCDNDSKITDGIRGIRDSL